MLMSSNAFISYSTTYLAALLRVDRLILCSGAEPTEAELDSGYDPLARTNKILSIQVTGGTYNAFTGTIVGNSALIEFSPEAKCAAIGPALISGTVTHAVLYRGDSDPSRREYVVIPVGVAGQEKTITLNKLQFNVGESVQVVSFSHKIRRK